MNNQDRMLLIAGVVFDTVGVGLLAFSIIQGGDFLWFALVLMGVGSFLIVAWSRKLSTQEQAATEPPADGALEGWTPEPELALPPPRQVELSSMGRWMAVLWVVALGVAVLYTGVLPRRPSPSQQLLDDYGAPASATIHRKETRSHAGGKTAYYLYYNFTDRNGKGVRASTAVDPDVYDSLKEGDTLKIVYFIDDPSTHRIEELDNGDLPRREGIIGLGILAIAFVAQDLHRRRHKRLTAYGATVPGIVKELRRSGAAVNYSVESEIRGHQRTLKGSERRSSLQQGDVLTVLFLPEKPQQAILYRQSLYRAAR